MKPRKRRKNLNTQPKGPRLPMNDREEVRNGYKGPFITTNGRRCLPAIPGVRLSTYQAPLAADLAGVRSQLLQGKKVA